MIVDEELEGTIEEISEELPENAPRYIVLSHPLVSRWISMRRCSH